MGNKNNWDAIFGVVVVILICSTRYIDCCSGGKPTKPDVLPTFSWDSESNRDAAKLVIDFHDKDGADVARLRRIKSVFGDDDLDEAENECIFRGILQNEPDVHVTVDGCPGNDTFQVEMHSKRSRDGTFMIKNGKVTVFHPAPTEDEIYENATEATKAPSNSLTGHISAVKLPSSIMLTLSIRYDNLFRDNVGKGRHSEARKRVEKIVDLAQNYFLDFEPLGTKIYFDIKDIKHVNDNFRLREKGTTCNSRCKIKRAINQRSSVNTLDVDNYHYFSHDDQIGGVAGIANKKWYKPSDYKGTVCWKNERSSDAMKDRKQRTAITEFTGPASTHDEWDRGKVGAALTFAHEIGHALGMPHDFIEYVNNPRKDSSGNSCLDVDGIMSYKDTQTGWSTCSKENMHGWFKMLTRWGINCKAGGSQGGCTDTNNGKADTYGDDCSAYVRNTNWCGKYDGNGFRSKKMCCACGGGSS